MVDLLRPVMAMTCFKRRIEPEVTAFISVVRGPQLRVSLQTEPVFFLLLTSPGNFGKVPNCQPCQPLHGGILGVIRKASIKAGG